MTTSAGLHCVCCTQLCLAAVRLQWVMSDAVGVQNDTVTAMMTSSIWLAGLLKSSGRHIPLQCNADWANSQSSCPSILCCGYGRSCCEHHFSAYQHHKRQPGHLCFHIRRRIILPMPLPECWCWNQPQLCKLYITSVSLQLHCHSLPCNVSYMTVCKVIECRVVETCVKASR